MIRARLLNIRAFVIILCTVGLLAGLGTWLYSEAREEQQDPCQTLARHERVSAALATANAHDSSCAELGLAIKQATTGPPDGQRPLAQAQAMKDVLVAIDDVIGENAAPLDLRLTGPVSMALTSYTEDIYEILIPSDVEYVRHALPSDEAWTDSEGAHMSVSPDSLIRIMVSLSVDPEAHGNLRNAMTRHVVQKLAASPRSTSEEALSSYPSITAWELGTMDAVARAARDGLDEDKRDSWEEETLARLSSKTAESVPSFDDDPVGHLVTSWKKSLPSDSPDDLLDVLEAQSTELVRVWTTALGTSDEVQASIVNEARGKAWSAQRSALRDLRG